MFLCQQIMQLSFHEAACVLFDASHARIMNIFLWFSGWSHIKSRRCSGAQGLNRQPTVAHICLCYPGHGGLKSLKKKAAGLLRHKRWYLTPHVDFLLQKSSWLHFSHQVVWKLSAFPLKYNSGIWAKPWWCLTPPCHVTYWGHLRHGVSV